MDFCLDHSLRALLKCVFCVCVCVLLSVYVSVCMGITQREVDSAPAAVIPQLRCSQCNLFTSLPVKCEAFGVCLFSGKAGQLSQVSNMPIRIIEGHGLYGITFT